MYFSQLSIVGSRQLLTKSAIDSVGAALAVVLFLASGEHPAKILQTIIVTNVRVLLRV